MEGCVVGDGLEGEREGWNGRVLGQMNEGWVGMLEWRCMW